MIPAIHLRSVLPAARLAAAISSLAFIVSGCGSGGRDSQDLSTQPAPQTLNGTVLTLYAGGVTLNFIRSSGDAVTGVETGGVTMTPNPLGTPIGSASNEVSYLIPSNTISGARYTYERSSPESGKIVVTGSGSGRGFDADGDLVTSNYFAAGSFRHVFRVLFGTDGVSISGVNVENTGVDYWTSIYSRLEWDILWRNATFTLIGGQPLPIGWNVAGSQTLDLPKLYPDTINRERMEISPADPRKPELVYQILNSTFTRFSDATGDFLEEGVANEMAGDDTEATIVNFDYQPDPTTTHKARIRIYNGKKVTTYNFTFLDYEKGTYVRANGETGTFEFPFLD